MGVEGLRRCLRPAAGAARLRNPPHLLRRRHREGRRVAGGGGLRGRRPGGLRGLVRLLGWPAETIEPEHEVSAPAPTASRAGLQRVVSLTVLSGDLPLSCTVVIALSMAGGLAGLGCYLGPPPAAGHEAKP